MFLFFSILEPRNNLPVFNSLNLFSEDTNNEMKDVEQQPMTPQRKNSTMSKGKDVDRHSTISEDIDWPNSDEDDEDILQAYVLTLIYTFYISFNSLPYDLYAVKKCQKNNILKNKQYKPEFVQCLQKPI
jgi:hypothetical protein